MLTGSIATPFMVGHAPKVEDSTLYLPRMLCLHGGGTNANIFRIQCRVLERSLRSSFRLVYAQAPFPAQPGSDVTSVYKRYGPFRAWQRSTSDDPDYTPHYIVDQIHLSLTATMHADDQRGATGPWVALMGFSQGAKIAASILYSQQFREKHSMQNTVGWPEFRFALLLAARGPLLWLEPEMAMPPWLVNASRPSVLLDEPVLVDDPEERLLRIPTIHVHGLSDPGLELHRRLLQRYCDPRCAALLEWDGGHRVPIKTRDIDAVVEYVYSVACDTGVLSGWS